MSIRVRLLDLGARSLWRMSSGHQVNFDQFKDSLEALIRALNVRFSALVGAQPGPLVPSPGGQPFRADGATGNEAGGYEADVAKLSAETGSGDADYRESALLANISQKFYESWAFKGLSAALLAGAVLGVGGALLLGGESYDLSGRLRKTYESSSADMKQIQETARAQASQFSTQSQQAIETLQTTQKSFIDKLKDVAIDQIVKQLKEAIDNRTGPINDRIKAVEVNLQPQLDAFSDRVKKLNTETSSLDHDSSRLSDRLGNVTATIEMKAKQFDTDMTSATADLKTNVVERTIRDLRQDIDRRTGAISDGIKDEEDRLQPKFDTLNTRVKALDSTATELDGKMDRASGLIAKLNMPLLEQNVGAVEQELARIRSDETATAQSMTKAAEYATAALRAQSDAAAGRDRVASQLDAVANGIPPQLAALNNITVSIAALRNSLNNTTLLIDSAAHDAEKLKEAEATLQSMSSKLSAVSQSVLSLQKARLELRIAALETNRPPPPAATDNLARTVDDLTYTERYTVQRQLYTCGFGRGTVDGSFGRNTYNAVRQWRKSVGSNENGKLRSAELDRLIGKRGDPVPPCPRQ